MCQCQSERGDSRWRSRKEKKQWREATRGIKCLSVGHLPQFSIPPFSRINKIIDSVSLTPSLPSSFIHQFSKCNMQQTGIGINKQNKTAISLPSVVHSRIFFSIFPSSSTGENAEDEKLDRKTSAVEFYLSSNDDDNEWWIFSHFTRTLKAMSGKLQSVGCGQRESRTLIPLNCRGLLM